LVAAAAVTGSVAVGYLAVAAVRYSDLLLADAAKILKLHQLFFWWFTV
jgi:hypothetical protein